MTRLRSWLSEGWYRLRRWLDMTFFFEAWYGPLDDDEEHGLDELKVWIHPWSRLRK